MSKEIERKWLFNYDMLGELDSLMNDFPSVEIKDYYFNDYCRLRYCYRDNVDLWYVTVKSEGDLIRDEYEFSINRDDINFLPVPMLRKTRYLAEFNDLPFDVNVFKDLMFGIFPLITVELEMESPSLVIENLPEYCGQEITHDMRFYGYNLFKCLRETTANNLAEGPKKDNVIQFRKAVDKTR